MTDKYSSEKPITAPDEYSERVESFFISFIQGLIKTTSDDGLLVKKLAKEMVDTIKAIVPNSKVFETSSNEFLKNIEQNNVQCAQM